MKKKALLAVVVPFVVMFLWVAKQAYDKQAAQTVELSVEGYDPRDLLSGHYLIYRVVYGERGNCKPHVRKDSLCQCLEVVGPGNRAQSAWLGECHEMPDSCKLYLRGRCDWGNRFVAGIERYYFPERYMDVLKTIPPKSTIQVGIKGNGSGMVTGFFVDGKELKQYVQEVRAKP